MRVVSLLPSATEIVYALGLGDQLVGVTFECDEPPSARAEKTVVVGGRDTRGMTPGEIDDYVKGQLGAGGDLYTLHAGALAGLDPELILTQDLCRVCALPSGQVSDALDHLGCRADVVSLDPYTLDEVFATFTTVAAAAGVPERGTALVAALRARLGADPLRDDADPAPAYRRISASTRPVFALLLDQSIVAGCGLIYANEVLFRAGLDPYTPGRMIGPACWDELWADLRALMKEGVARGRIDTVHTAHTPEAMQRAPRVDRHGGEVYVYRRPGLPCYVCGTAIARGPMAGRNLYWCPTCQPVVAPRRARRARSSR